MRGVMTYWATVGGRNMEKYSPWDIPNIHPLFLSQIQCETRQVAETSRDPGVARSQVPTTLPEKK